MTQPVLPARQARDRRDNHATKQSLTPRRRECLALLQRIRFGRVHRLRVRGGEPDLACGVSWTRTVKVAGRNEPHPCSHSPDFPLKSQVGTFFDLLAAVGEGEVRNIEVRDGLPVLFEIEESLTPES